jgi:hypothetical protein
MDTMRKTLLAIGLALAGLFFVLRPAVAEQDSLVPELTGKLDCGSLDGDGKILVYLFDKYIGTFRIRCEKV